MIELYMLDMHHSFPSSKYGDLEELKKRPDLYTEGNFYFSFSSNDKTYLHVIGDHRPLAIKYGPTFALYSYTIDGYHCAIYYINAQTKTLSPIIRIEAKFSQRELFHQLIPFSFVNQNYMLDMGLEDKKEVIEDSPIKKVLELIGNNDWPDEKLNHSYIKTIEEINNNSKQEVNCISADLNQLKVQNSTGQNVLGLEQYTIQQKL